MVSELQKREAEEGLGSVCDLVRIMRKGRVGQFMWGCSVCSENNGWMPWRKKSG